MIYIGIDPGALSGAWAIIDHNGYVACGDIKSIDGRVCAYDLYWAIKDNVRPNDSAMIAVESVHAMPKQGVSSTAKFMRAAGAIEAVAELSGYKFVLVTPQKWKKHHDLIGSEKQQSLILAREIFPDADLRLKKHTGRADALLMAKWLKDEYE